MTSIASITWMRVVFDHAIFGERRWVRRKARAEPICFSTHFPGRSDTDVGFESCDRGEKKIRKGTGRKEEGKKRRFRNLFAVGARCSVPLATRGHKGKRDAVVRNFWVWDGGRRGGRFVERKPGLLLCEWEFRRSLQLACYRVALSRQLLRRGSRSPQMPRKSGFPDPYRKMIVIRCLMNRVNDTRGPMMMRADDKTKVAGHRIYE